MVELTRPPPTNERTDGRTLPVRETATDGRHQKSNFGDDLQALATGPHLYRTRTQRLTMSKTRDLRRCAVANRIPANLTGEQQG